jgi:hypothetical protein
MLATTASVGGAVRRPLAMETPRGASRLSIQQSTDGHKAALLIAPDDGIRHHRKAKTFLRHQLVSFSPVPRREGNAYKPSMVEILPSVVEEVSASRALRGAEHVE